MAFAFSLIGDMIGSSSMESLRMFPLILLVVKMVIVSEFVLMVSRPFISDTGISERVVNLISLESSTFFNHRINVITRLGGAFHFAIQVGEFDRVKIPSSRSQ